VPTASTITPTAAGYRDSLGMVEKTVRRLLGRSDGDFDDMVQVAMIELIRSLGRFRGECSVDTWTSTLSANVVTNTFATDVLRIGYFHVSWHQRL
jgi:DNA-directed RNA polymerase specialized sigma24 family protein